MNQDKLQVKVCTPQAKKQPSLLIIPTRDHDHPRDTTEVWWTTMHRGEPVHFRFGSIAVNDPDQN